jgi:hypothetical protein
MTRDPLRVDWVDLSSVPGLRGVATAGGRLGMTGVGGHDLAVVAEALRGEHRADAFVLLLEGHDVLGGRVPEIAGEGFELLRLPIRDMDVPSDRAALRLTLDDVPGRLRAGQTVVIACYGGYGRTGTVVGCLLRAAGLDGAAAIALARATRPGAIERPGQINFVEDWGSDGI